jgi:hypothetical protein
MFSKWRQIGLVTLGILVGVMISLNYSAVAQRGLSPLPVLVIGSFRELLY